MPAAILTINYELGDAQKELSAEAWQTQARDIASIPGLRWKYWLQEPQSDERGGVYLLESVEAAKRAEGMLVGALEGAGARNVRHRVMEVDADLSAITRGSV